MTSRRACSPSSGSTARTIPAWPPISTRSPTCSVSVGSKWPSPRSCLLDGAHTEIAASHVQRSNAQHGSLGGAAVAATPVAPTGPVAAPRKRRDIGSLATAASWAASSPKTGAVVVVRNAGAGAQLRRTAAVREALLRWDGKRTRWPRTLRRRPGSTASSRYSVTRTPVRVEAREGGPADRRLPGRARMRVDWRAAAARAFPARCR